MNNVEQLLTEYSSITGRPLATISVSEYLEFKKYSDRMITPMSTQFNMPVEIATPVTREPESQVVPIKEIREEKAVKTDASDNSKNKKSSAFAMMRSIGG